LRYSLFNPANLPLRPTIVSILPLSLGVLLASIIAYLLLTILIGYWASRRVKTSGDFMLAGRSLPLALSSAALFATWFGSETVFWRFVGIPEGRLVRGDRRSIRSFSLSYLIRVVFLPGSFTP